MILTPLVGLTSTDASFQTGVGARIGTAQKIQGQWSVERGALDVPLKEGERLLPGAIINPPAGPDPAALEVLYDDGEPATFVCPRDCTGAIRLKLTLKPTPSTWRSRWAFVERLFWGNPARYRSTITRGDNVARDLVVRLDPDCIDIGAALGDIRHGAYQVQLRRVGTGDERRYTDREFEWDGSGCVRVSPQPEPGLYDVTMQQGGTSADAVTPFWVLLLQGDRYAEAAAAHKDARAVLGGVETAERRAILRAFIDQLARESIR